MSCAAWDGPPRYRSRRSPRDGRARAGCAASSDEPPWRRPATPWHRPGPSGRSCARASRPGARWRSGPSTGSCSGPRCGGRAPWWGSTSSIKASCKSSAPSGSAGDAGAAIDVADPGVGLLAPDLIVVVEVELGLADQRLAARPGRESRVEGDGVDRRRELERQAELVEELLAAWMERFGDRIPTTVKRIANGPHPLDVAGAGGIAATGPAGPTEEPRTGATRSIRGALMRTATPARILCRLIDDLRLFTSAKSGTTPT